MKIRPLDDKVLIEPVEIDERVGSLVIPEMAKEKPLIGIILAIGNDTGDLTPTMSRLFSVGDRVLFGKYAGQEVKLNEKKCLLISREDLLAVIEDEVEA